MKIPDTEGRSEGFVVINDGILDIGQYLICFIGACKLVGVERNEAIEKMLDWWDDVELQEAFTAKDGHS